MQFRLRVGIAFGLVFLCGCKGKIDPKHGVASFRALSTAELFELESKCNVMGQKVLDSNTIGTALTKSQASHYNTDDNRCYVLLDVSTADLRTPLGDFTSDSSLIDGQTGQTWATTLCKGRRCTADIFDESLKRLVKDPITPSQTEVRELMEKFVHTERHLSQENTP